MANKRLNVKDVERLLSEYRGERRRLNYQLDLVRKAIIQLKTIRSEEAPRADGPVLKRGPGRPKKDPSSGATRKTAARKKPGRRKKRVVQGGGYRLSDWDQMVINAITKSNKLLPKEDLLKAAVTWARKNEPELNEDEVQAKLTRVLQKLSGKRGSLGTHRSGLRRGYHYGIKDWFFTSSGLLRKQHYDKLVLTEK